MCDVVNGTREKKAYFLSPAPFELHGQTQLRQYRSRLSPPSHREARFRDSLPDLPDVIHIQTEIESNVSFLTNLLTSDRWQQLPSLDNTTRSNKSNKKKSKAARGSRSQAESRLNAWAAPPAVPGLQHATQVDPVDRRSPMISNDQRLPGREQRDDRMPPANEEHSVASTENTTLATESQYQATESQYQARLQELRSETRSKLKKLEDSGDETTTRLKSLEKQFTKFDDLDQKVAAVKDELHALSKQLEDSVETQQAMSSSLLKMQANTKLQFNDLGGHVIGVVEHVNTLSDTVTRMRAEVRQFMQMLSTLADRQYHSETEHRNHLQTPPSANMPIPNRQDHTPEMPTLLYLSDTSGSSQSKSSSSASSPSDDSESTEFPSSPETEPSLLRSPPPKRTREGLAVTEEEEEDEEDDDVFMQVDPIQHDDPSAIDISFEDADEDDDYEDDPGDTASTDRPVDFNVDNTVCTNLTERFDQVDNPSTRAFSSLQVAATSTPRTSNTTSTQVLPLSPITRTLPAPLDPQYTSDTGPAGASEP